jgi:hypothetical protein
MLAVEADQAEQSWKAITACEVYSRCDCASALRGSARRELAATDLDLSSAKPPIREIIADFEKVYAESPIMYVVARTPGARPTRSAARRLRMVGAERLRLGRADRPPWRLARNSPLAGVASGAGRAGDATLGAGAPAPPPLSARSPSSAGCTRRSSRRSGPARLLERLALPGASGNQGRNPQLAELRNCSGRLAAQTRRTA